MTLNDFLTKNIGQSVESSDPNNLFQCMDLAYAWCDAMEVPRETIKNLHAYEVWTKPKDITLDYFDYVPNTPNGLPKVGDLIVFNQGVGPSGHISVATGKGDVNVFTSFDQNWNRMTSAQLVDHNYVNVYGWLHRKPSEASGLLASIAQKLNVEEDLKGILTRLDTLLSGERVAAEKDREILELKQRPKENDSLAMIAQQLNVPAEQTSVRTKLETLLMVESAIVERDQRIQSLSSQISALKGAGEEIQTEGDFSELTLSGLTLLRTGSMVKNVWNFLKGKNMIIAGLLLIALGLTQDDPQRIMEGFGLIGLRLLLLGSKKLRPRFSILK